MTDTQPSQRLQTCQPTAATLILVEEALLTRTAITAATAANYAEPVKLAVGDARLARLATILKGIDVSPAKFSTFEPRTVVTMTCADGSSLVIEASATEDGVIHLKIGDTHAMSKSPLRQELEALIAH